MKIITKKNASKNKKIKHFVVMSISEWLKIGKKAGFIKYQSNFSKNFKKYMNDMEPVSDYLKSILSEGRDSDITIDDSYFLGLIKKYTGENYADVPVSSDKIRLLAHQVSEGLKSKYKLIENKSKEIKQKLLNDPSDIDITDIGMINEEEEISIPDELKEDPEVSQEIKTEIEEDLKQDDPINAFDRAAESLPNGTFIIKSPYVLGLIEEITGNNYSEQEISPVTIEEIRSSLVDYYEPSEDIEESKEETIDDEEKIKVDSLYDEGLLENNPVLNEIDDEDNDSSKDNSNFDDDDEEFKNLFDEEPITKKKNKTLPPFPKINDDELN